MAVFFFFLLIFLVMISRVPRFLIEQIVVDGGSASETFEIMRMTNDMIADSYLGIFPKRNIFLVPKNKIRQKLILQLPRVRTVEFNADRGKVSEFRVKVVEREIAYLSCEKRATRKKCFYMDKEGVVFGEAPEFSRNILFEFYGSISGGAQIEKILGIRSIFERTLGGAGIDVRSVAAYFVGQNDYEISFGEWNILGNLGVNDEEISYTLAAVLKTESFQNKWKDASLKPGYIDLRFGNKAYYKFDPREQSVME